MLFMVLLLLRGDDLRNAPHHLSFRSCTKRKTVPRPVPERKDRQTRAPLYLSYRFIRGYRAFPLSGRRNDTFAAHPSALSAAHGRRKTAFTNCPPRSIAAAAYARAAAWSDIFPHLYEEFFTCRRRLTSSFVSE